MFGIGFSELILILVVALVIFGPDKMPDVGKTIGKTVKEFKSAVNKIDAEVKRNVEDVTEAAGVKDTLDDVKNVSNDFNKFGKELKDIGKINPLKMDEPRKPTEVDLTNAEITQNTAEKSAAETVSETPKADRLITEIEESVPVEEVIEYTAQDIKPVKVKL